MKKYLFMFNFKLFMYCRISQRWLFLSIIDIKMINLKNDFIQYFNNFMIIILQKSSILTKMSLNDHYIYIILTVKIIIIIIIKKML